MYVTRSSLNESEVAGYVMDQVIKPVDPYRIIIHKNGYLPTHCVLIIPLYHMLSQIHNVK